MSGTKIAIVVLLGMLVGLLWLFHPWILFILFLIAIIIHFIFNIKDKNERNFILKIFLIGFLVRIALIVITHPLAIMGVVGIKPIFMETDGALIGDDRFYYLYANQIGSFFRGQSATLKGEFPAVVGSGIVNGYIYFLGVIYGYLGSSPLLGKVLNSLLGTLIGILTYYITKSCFENKSVAKLNGATVILWPTLLLWSITNLKDTVLIFSILLVLLIAVKINRMSTFLKFLPVLVLLLFFIESIRIYFGKMMIITLMAYIFALWILKGFRKKIIVIMLAIIIGISILNFAKKDNIFNSVKLTLNHAISLLINKQTGYVSESLRGNVYEIYDKDISNADFLGILRAYVKGIYNFIFQPFPWVLNRRLNILLLPQIVVWCFVVIFSIVRIYRSLFMKDKKVLLILFYLFIFLSVSALSEGSIGNAVRHRDIITPIIIILASAGLLRIRK